MTDKRPDPATMPTGYCTSCRHRNQLDIHPNAGTLRYRCSSCHSDTIYHVHNPKAEPVTAELPNPNYLVLGGKPIEPADCAAAATYVDCPRCEVRAVAEYHPHDDATRSYRCCICYQNGLEPITLDYKQSRALTPDERSAMAPTEIVEYVDDNDGAPDDLRTLDDDDLGSVNPDEMSTRELRIHVTQLRRIVLHLSRLIK